MAMPPAPMTGRRNCSRCTRWRPVTDFAPGRTRRRDGTVIDPPQLSSWCDPCRRRTARARAARAYAAKKRRAAKARSWVLGRARRRVEAGDAFWCGPFRDWLLEPGELGAPNRAERHSWTILAVWGGVDESALRYAVHPDALTINVDVVDRILLWEGSTRLDDLYPLEDPDRGAIAA